jgi:hypothetical protein
MGMPAATASHSRSTPPHQKEEQRDNSQNDQPVFHLMSSFVNSSFLKFFHFADPINLGSLKTLCANSWKPFSS